MIIFEPIWPWSYIAALAAFVAGVSMLLRGLLDYLKKNTLWLVLGGSKITRIAVLSLSLLVSILLAVAALNPIWTDKPARAHFHLQTLVDVSDSVLRSQGGWESLRQTSYQNILASIAATPQFIQQKCTAGITTFRDDSFEALTKHPLKDLPEKFIKLDKNSFAGGQGTDIEQGLNAAATALESAGGQGAVLLISDGNEISGHALLTAQQLARQGIPIHVLPITSRSPAVAITDADLPRQTHVEAETFLRGLLLNRLDKNKIADLTTTTRTTRVTLEPDVWVRFRWPIQFDSFGLQFIDLALTPIGEKSLHSRRFFTYAKRPPRLLAIGGDNRWISAVSGDVAEIIPVPPEDLILPEDLKEIDAVVISGIPADTLPLQSMISIQQAIEKDGKGLLLINGNHQGADAETATVIMSYKNSPLAAVLPVVGGPRPVLDEPPPRQVVILMDTSGSMVGWKINKSIAIAKYIIQYLLRPKDRLDVITFTTGAGQLITDREMNDQGKQEALESIDRIQGGGGTDPQQALELIGNRQMSQCGMIFISDGEFELISYRPDCRVTVFEIGGSTFSQSPALKQLADPIPVPGDFDPKAITIPYFEPQKRNKFYEAQSFSPLAMGQHLPKHLRLPVPTLQLDGSAVSYLREGAILIGVRPKLIDPVLAFKQVGLGFCGYFASALSGPWLKEKEGSSAISAWIGRLVPFMERDRYDFLIEDYGDSLDIRVSLVVKSGKLPDVTGMTGVIQFPGQETTGVALRADQTLPGTFQGEIRVDRKDRPRHAFLVLRESGPDAIAREQRVPIMIPAKGSVNASPTAEAYSYGQNRTLLRQIAEAGGGMFNPPKGTPFFTNRPATQDGSPLWPLLSVIAVFCYLAAITLKRWNP